MKLIILVIALVVALVVAYGVSTFVNEKKAEPKIQVLSAPPAQIESKVQKVDIYVAQHDLPIGTILSPADYDIKHWSQSLLPPGALAYGKDNPSIDGMITRTSIAKDSPLLTTQLRNPNDPTYIPGQLGEGMRAITVPANLTSSVAGFIAPGDKVDVLFTFELIKSAVQGGDVSSMKSAAEDRNVAFTEVLLPNVRVLAVDTRVSAELPPQKEGQPAQPIPSSVTLEVNQRDVQKLKLAQKTGEMTMVLRSVKDKDSFDIVRPTAEQDLTRIMPPAYFPVLYDNNSNYDFSVVDLYGQTLGGDRKNCGMMTLDPKSGKMVKKCGDNAMPDTSKNNETQNPQMSVNVYRGIQLEKVEVNKP